MSIQDWPLEKLKILDDFNALPDLTYERAKESLRACMHPFFERTPLGLLVFRSGVKTKVLPRGTIVANLGTTKPRFLVTYITSEESLNAVRWISQISTSPVKMFSVDWAEDSRLAEYMEVELAEVQTVYDVHHILTNFEKLIGKGNQKILERNMQEVIYTQLTPDRLTDALEVIGQWRQVAGKRQSIILNSDSRLLKLVYWKKLKLDAESFYGYIGYREGFPVSVFFTEKSAIQIGWASSLAAKSLNFPSLPGGSSGISYLTTLINCTVAAQVGISWLNTGTWVGGTEGLKKYKYHFAKPEDDLVSYHWKSKDYFRGG